MARRSFAHTERPQGNPRPAHRTKALDALSALAQRGGADINAERLRKPMPDKKLGEQPKLPSPVAMEAMNRSPQGQVPQRQMPQGYFPQGQAPQAQVPVEQGAPQMPAEQVEPQGMEFTPPPVEGYYGQLLAESLARDPATQQGQRDWRHDFLDRASQLRQKLDMVRTYLNSGDVEAAQDVQAGMQDGGWKDYVREKRQNMADV